MTKKTIPSHCTNCGAKLRSNDHFCTKCGTAVKQDVRRTAIGLPLWIWVVGAVVLAAVAFLVFNGARPNSPAATNGTNVPDVHDAEGIPYPEVPRHSVEEAKLRWDAKAAIFVDVRGKSDYAAGHIPNAVALPLAQIEAGDPTLPLQAEILTYCT